MASPAPTCRLPVCDDLGDPLFLGLLIVIGLAGWFAQYLRLSVDAALTVMIGLTSLAATWGVWTDRYEVDGAFGLWRSAGADGFSLVITGVIAGAIVLVALLLDDYLEREGMAGAEMYVLMLFSALVVLSWRARTTSLCCSSPSKR